MHLNGKVFCDGEPWVLQQLPSVEELSQSLIRSQLDPFTVVPICEGQSEASRQCKRPTATHGAPLHAEVSAATGPLLAKLRMTRLQWGPVAH